MLGIPNGDKLLENVAASVDAAHALATAINSLAEATDRQTRALIAQEASRSLKSHPGGW